MAISLVAPIFGLFFTGIPRVATVDIAEGDATHEEDIPDGSPGSSIAYLQATVQTKPKSTG